MLRSTPLSKHRHCEYCPHHSLLSCHVLSCYWPQEGAPRSRAESLTSGRHALSPAALHLPSALLFGEDGNLRARLGHLRNHSLWVLERDSTHFIRGHCLKKPAVAQDDSLLTLISPCLSASKASVHWVSRAGPHKSFDLHVCFPK